MDMQSRMHTMTTRSQSQGRYLIAIVLCSVAPGCVPLGAVRGGAGINTADSGVRTVVEADLGVTAPSEPIGLYAVTGTFYEGTHDILAFGPKVGWYPGQNLKTQVTVAAETGPVLVDEGPNDWYGGIKTSIATTSDLMSEDLWIPLGLSLQGQIGYRFGPDEWRGWRVGVALVGGFVFP
jgi:hypothetical protein